ncbi:NAD(P)H-binding protein [Paraburkholderia bannensis]|uniref:NAD(P)H-binding protein n=1 Tax=Paraburkholderia bannensis TaxID=765414 RepID=UPI00048750F8|nr:NAD(P)H-binding protein [Paraburkholderia bannensis]
MFAIVGATGKVGYATASALRKAGLPVRGIVRDAAKGNRLREIGCDIAVADLHDAAGLATAIGDASGVQVILPSDPRARDTALDMRHTIESLANALEQTRPMRILAVSDYGAHVAHDIGMPSLFRAFEARLGQLQGQKLILRSAEHMENWGRALPAAMASGVLPSFQEPLDMTCPTISAPDLGRIAADLWLRPASAKDNKDKDDRDVEIVHAEGPRRYSARDVAAALGQLLGRAIDVRAVPRSQWKDAFERVMNAPLADLLIKANDARNEGGLVDVEPAGTVCHGTTGLIDALRPLIATR